MSVPTKSPSTDVTEENWTAQMTGVHFIRQDEVPTQDYAQNA